MTEDTIWNGTYDVEPAEMAAIFFSNLELKG
jgi:hypothetical protein